MNRGFRLAPILDALRFHDAHLEKLTAIAPEHWKALLSRTDHARLTLPLGVRCRDWLPAFVRGRIDRDLSRNAERHQRLRTEYGRIAALFVQRGIEFLVLKGAAHWPYFCDHPHHRPQYDFDLWCALASLEAARAAAAELGFEAVEGRRDGPTDHLPTLIRRTGWRWRSDYFDPEMPPSLEIHFRLWNPVTECIEVKGPEDFLTRCSVREVAGVHIPALSLPDTLSYATLHTLRHLLRGDLCPYHVYEIAHFLERSHQDTEFWNSWRAFTSHSLRSVATLAFRLAHAWFRCRLPPAAEAALAPPLENWLDRFALSPLRDSPNKDELWLHLALVPDWRARRGILLRRLLPRPANVSLAPHVPSKTLLWKVRQRLYQARFTAIRAVYHLRALFGSALRAASSRASQISR